MTLAAYECGSVEFPEPPYPDQIVCPQEEAPTSGPGAEQVDVGADGMVGPATLQGSVSLWTIISKVRLEACMWVSFISVLTPVGTSKAFVNCVMAESLCSDRNQLSLIFRVYFTAT